MADEKDKDAKPEGEMQPKLALLSGKGILVVFLLLALEGVGGAAAYFLATRSSTTSETTGKAVIIPQGKIKTMIPTGEGQKQVTVSFDLYIEVQPAAAESVKKHLAELEPVMKSRISDKIREIKPPSEVNTPAKIDDLKQWIVGIYNTTLKEYAPRADQATWKDGAPVTLVWINEIQVQ